MKTLQRALWAATLTLLSVAAHGQTATITGTITDSSGSVMPNVAIAVTNTATNAARRVQTDASGNYVAPLLPVGQYRVEASIQGFQKAAAVDITLNINETLRIDLQLKPGAISETVEVVGAAAIVQSETATVGNVIDTQKVVELPLNGRRFENLALLVPGVTTTNPSASGGVPGISAGGGRFSSNNFRLDGINNVSEAGGVGLALRPIIDAIQEFKIQTNSYSAEFGRGGGANIQVTTKSGGNQFHGNVWEFLRNDALDARGFFEVQKQEFRRNQFGATLGGPIKRDRTFFFFAYEGTRRLTAAASRQAVPTAAFRSGTFGTTVVRDPLSGTNFAGNQIPSSRFSPQALAILNFYPLPTPGLTGASNYLAKRPQTDDQDQFNGRVDHHFGSANTLFGRWASNKTNVYNPCIGNANTACIPGFPTIGINRTSQVAISDIHIFSGRLINELRGGLNWVKNSNTSTFSSALGGSNIGASLGIPGLPSSTNSLDWGMPNIAIAGYGGLGSQGYNTTAPAIWDFVDSLSYLTGNHSIRTGVEFTYQKFDAQIGRARDNLTFDGRFTGNAFGDFLLGFPSQTVQNPSDFVRFRRSSTFAGFVQDDWKIRQNLTFNVGVRYDYQTPDLETQDRAVNVNSNTFKVELAGKDGVSRGIYEGDKKNVSPRFGLAYRPANGFVVRGGYGMFFDIAFQGSQLGQVKQGPPFFVNSTYNASANPLDLTLNNVFPSGRLQASNIFDYRSVQKDFKNGYLQQWNLGVQKSAGNAMVVEVGYIGTKGTHLYRNIDINQALPGAGLVQARRPLQQYGSLLMLQSQGGSSYHGLISRFERRFSRGITFLSAYTWSHSIDNFSASNPNATGGQNVRDFRSERANSDFDTRHRLVMSYVYEIPVGKGRQFLSKLPMLVDGVLGGWQFSGVSTFQSGNPLNVAIQGNRSNTGTTNLDRPNATGSAPRYESGGDKTFFLNPAAYSLQALNTFGNAGRNSAVGPGIISTDLSIAKKFTNEKWVTEFRGELFNAFNHPLLAQPVAFANTALFGRIQATRGDNRQIQFGLKISR